MLRLKKITKNYKVAGGEIQVLKGLDIAFRKSEFVSILGPSGCGKTTTLNIIGGLDKYTSGDLVIAGKSTKNFTDRDWDIYRNQRIGFIFQSYNLIPHQTVLGNVELALTISGVSKEERVARSLRALERVGLKGEEYKRPNQLSGGQCQRVAIARALVNEPDILLADEPTGALDSKTSVQIMDLIKEISKDKLVIMVTHNSEIAEEYSTRIVRLVDGEIVEDTNPYSEEEEISAVNNEKTLVKSKKAKAKMSWWTAFKLSARNLFTKRGRTALVSIAGSIGIIGISAVIAVSTGVRTFIADMQDDMLSGNPITVKATAYDFDSIMDSISFSEKVEFVKKDGYVNVDSTLEFLAKQGATSISSQNVITNDYINYVKAMPKDYAALKINYGLDVTNNIYTNFTPYGDRYENGQLKYNGKTQNVSISAIKNIYTSVMKETEFKDQATLISSLSATFMQAPNDNEYILSQYKLLDGKVASGVDEVMIVVNKDRALADLTLAQLGYYTQEEFLNLAYSEEHGSVSSDGGITTGKFDPELEKKQFSYKELREKEFVWYPNDTVFSDNFAEVDHPFIYNYENNGFTGGKRLKVVGILEPKDNINFGCLTAGVYYTEAFADYVLQESKDSNIVQFVKNPLQFLKIDPNDPDFDSKMMQTLYYRNGITSKIGGVDSFSGLAYNFYYYYEDMRDDIEPVAKKGVGVAGQANFISNMISSMVDKNAPVMEEFNLTIRQMGGADVLSEDISIYPTSFEMKDKVITYLEDWNGEDTITVKDQNGAEKELAGVGTTGGREEIKYTDTLSLIIAMINSMIDIVTIALVAFTSLSLVVSCVMIAIITYVSVVERVKEIGVIRSLGGRKRDVSNLFNAETIVIGATSGLFGVGVTYFISLIVNLIVQAAAGFSIMILPFTSALLMVGLSIFLTVMAGIIPSSKAAKQDPVVALRTE